MLGDGPSDSVIRGVRGIPRSPRDSADPKASVDSADSQAPRICADSGGVRKNPRSPSESDGVRRTARSPSDSDGLRGVRGNWRTEKIYLEISKKKTNMQKNYHLRGLRGVRKVRRADEKSAGRTPKSGSGRKNPQADCPRTSPGRPRAYQNPHGLRGVRAESAESVRSPCGVRGVRADYCRVKTPRRCADSEKKSRSPHGVRRSPSESVRTPSDSRGRPRIAKHMPMEMPGACFNFMYF